MTRPACEEADPEDFYPETRGSNGLDRYTNARAICGTCTIRLDCLDWTLKLEGNITGAGRFGMFGGLTPDERAALARQRTGRRSRAS